MSVKIKLVCALLLCAVLLSLGACAVKIDPPAEISSEQEAINMGFSAVEHDGKIAAGSYEYLSVNIKLDYVDEVRWSTSNPEVAVVDSNGRVDGIKEGEATITATAKSATIDYAVVVTKAAKATTSYSTAFTDNEEYVEKNTAIISDKAPYAIIVNEYNCSVTVFTYDTDSETGYYNVPVRTMVCSTAKSPLVPFDDSEDTGEKDNEDNTIRESIGDKSEWVYLSDGKYYRWATYIGEDLMFQSAPYSKQDPASLISDEFNKIGTPATAKNIRLSAADAKWIYDNCDEGTQVRIVNSDKTTFSPLGVPAAMPISETAKSLKWDPTDSTKGNPYLKVTPVISGADDVVIEVETGFDPYDGVTAVDTCGNDITSKITVDGDFDRNVEGRYVISYYVTDGMGRTTRADREITVTDDISKFTTAPKAE